MISSTLHPIIGITTKGKFRLILLHTVWFITKQTYNVTLVNMDWLLVFSGKFDSLII